MPFIELFEGFFVDPEWIAVVKASVDDKKCALFTPGQSAINEGFYIPFSAKSVVEQLNGTGEIGDDEEGAEGDEEEGDEEKEDEDEEEEVASRE